MGSIADIRRTDQVYRVLAGTRSLKYKPPTELRCEWLMESDDRGPEEIANLLLLFTAGSEGSLVKALR